MDSDDSFEATKLDLLKSKHPRPNTAKQVPAGNDLCVVGRPIPRIGGTSAAPSRADDVKPVLSKYVDRFRYAEPQSRDTRMMHGGAENDSFWWLRRPSGGRASPALSSSSSRSQQSLRKNVKPPVKPMSRLPRETVKQGAPTPAQREKISKHEMDPFYESVERLQLRAEHMLQKHGSLATSPSINSISNLQSNAMKSPHRANGRRDTVSSSSGETNTTDGEEDEEYLPRDVKPRPCQIRQLNAGPVSHDIIPAVPPMTAVSSLTPLPVTTIEDGSVDILAQWRMRRRMELARMKQDPSSTAERYHKMAADVPTTLPYPEEIGESRLQEFRARISNPRVSPIVPSNQVDHRNGDVKLLRGSVEFTAPPRAVSSESVGVGTSPPPSTTAERPVKVTQHGAMEVGVQTTGMEDVGVQVDSPTKLERPRATREAGPSTDGFYPIRTQQRVIDPVSTATSRDLEQTIGQVVRNRLADESVRSSWESSFLFPSQASDCTPPPQQQRDRRVTLASPPARDSQLQHESIVEDRCDESQLQPTAAPLLTPDMEARIQDLLDYTSDGEDEFRDDSVLAELRTRRAQYIDLARRLTGVIGDRAKSVDQRLRHNASSS